MFLPMTRTNSRKLPGPVLSVLFVVFFLGQAIPGLAGATALTGSEALTEVVVTGSFLPTADATALPVTHWTSDELQRIPLASRTASFLQGIHQAGRASNSLSTGGSSTLNGGLSTADLRGLGPNRTLVLLNGKRLVGGDPLNPTTADLNTIPMDWIERVEVYTGGATAVYGSDAIAGVINVITRSEFQGAELKATYGISSENDGEETGLSLSAGSPFSDHRGHLALNLRWDQNQAIWAREREFSAHAERLGDRYAHSQFTPAGTIFAANNQVLVPSADGLWTENYNVLSHGYNAARERQLYVPLERSQGQLTGSFELSKNMRVYAQLGGGAHDSSNQQEAATVLNIPNTSLPPRYPFFPDEVLRTWLDNGMPLPPQIRYTRRLNEMGPRIYQQDREYWRVLAGMETTFGHWSSDLSYLESRSDFSQTSSGHHHLARMSWALNLEEDPANPGSYRCAVEAARAMGCVPVNLFSGDGISSAALEFVRAEQTYGAQFQMKEWQWRLQGPLTPLPAGDLAAVVGTGWRKESVESTVDPLTRAGLISSVALNPVNGEIEIGELFTELYVPLLKGRLVEAVEMSLAYRLSDYDSIGSAHSWNAGLNLSLTPQTHLYARKSLAIRAPNVSEFYLPPTGSNRPISDPCAAGSVVSAQVRENCRSLGIESDYMPTAQELTVPMQVSGNPYLEEEKAHTTTLGFAYRPWSNLSLQVSWFDVDLGNAIANVDPNFKLRSCYSSADFPNHPLCRGLNRGGEADNFRFLGLQLGPENIAKLRTRGMDTELDSTLAIGGGHLQNRVLITYTERLLQEANGQRINRINEPGAQRWKASYLLGYTQGPWQIALSGRYLGSALIENDSIEPYIRSNNNLPSMTYWSAYISRALSLAGKMERNTRISLGVQNLTDRQPPYVPSPSRTATLGSGTAAGVYDVRGRFWQLGAEYHF